MPQKFIVVGPIEGFYHIVYKIPGTTVWSSILECGSLAFAEEYAADMNGEQEKHDQEKS